MYRTHLLKSNISQPFHVGPAPSLAPTTTVTYTPTVLNETSTGPTSSSPPSYDGVTMTLVLQLDEYSSETSWSISDDKLTNFASRPVGYYEEMQSQLILEQVQLPWGQYQFQISDFMGDGISGWYSLYIGEDIEDSAQLFNHSGDVSNIFLDCYFMYVSVVT